MKVTKAYKTEIDRQMSYKSIWYGSSLQYADRFFPSSKKCSECGTIKSDLKLSDRTFHCPNTTCNLTIDRDENASRNLAMLADSSSESLNASGVGKPTMNEEESMKLVTRDRFL